MCGRYTATWSPEQFKRSFNVQLSLFESFNIAPSQYAPVIWQPQGNTEVLNARWGLIPKWVEKPFEFKASMFNARAETVSEKASFKRPFKRQRCLVPASGFYEWKKTGSGKEPYYIHAGSSLLAFAGLYDHWQKDGDEIYSYTIITTAANEMMSGLHERMPVILPPAHYEAWLDPEGIVRLTAAKQQRVRLPNHERCQPVQTPPLPS